MLCFSISVSIVGQMLTPIGEAFGLDAAMTSALLPMLAAIVVGFLLHKKTKRNDAAVDREG